MLDRAIIKRIGGFIGRTVFSIILLSIVAAFAPAVAQQEPAPPAGQKPLGETVDVGTTGFAAKRPVFAGACFNGCPWGELGEFVRDAMAPAGYEVIVCENCNGQEGPRIVAKASLPAALTPGNLLSGVTKRINARSDFGVTETGFLAAAYDGRGVYAKDGPYKNLRLIAKIDDPTYLLVAVKASSGITDLSQIKERKLPVKIMVSGEGSDYVLKYYGLTREAVESWGGSFVHGGRGKEPEFDLFISDLGSPANNPESSFWSTASQKYDLKFLDLPEEVLTRLVAIPGEMRVTAQWGLLRGVDHAIKTVGRNGEAVFGRDDTPEQAAYDVAKAIDTHRADLLWYIRPYSYNPDSVWKNLDVPLHPGAERYYRERGYMH